MNRRPRWPVAPLDPPPQGQPLPPAPHHKGVAYYQGVGAAGWNVHGDQHPQRFQQDIPIRRELEARLDNMLVASELENDRLVRCSSRRGRLELIMTGLIPHGLVRAVCFLAGYRAVQSLTIA